MEKHQLLYPSFDQSSFVDESSMANSHALLSQQEDDEEVISVNEDGELDPDSATESEENADLAEPLRPGAPPNV